MRPILTREVGAYDIDFASLGRLRQRLLSDTRVKAEQLRKLLACIDTLIVDIRPFVNPTDTDET